MLQACTASRVLIMRPDPDSRWKGRNRISRVHLKAQGGAMMALGNSTIKRLARRARYSGRIEQLVEELDRDDDLVRDSQHLTKCLENKARVPHQPCHIVKTLNEISRTAQLSRISFVLGPGSRLADSSSSAQLIMGGTLELRVQVHQTRL